VSANVVVSNVMVTFSLLSYNNLLDPSLLTGVIDK
jgi:hypothetical protein